MSVCVCLDVSVCVCLDVSVCVCLDASVLVKGFLHSKPVQGLKLTNCIECYYTVCVCVFGCIHDFSYAFV